MLPRRARRPTRRAKHAKKLPGGALDVSRVEFENLYSEVVGLTRNSRRIEIDLQRLIDRVHKLERRNGKNDR